MPVPDPTKLTTDQLRREIMALGKYWNSALMVMISSSAFSRNRAISGRPSLMRRHSICGSCWSSNSVRCGRTWLANWKS